MPQHIGNSTRNVPAHHTNSDAQESGDSSLDSLMRAIQTNEESLQIAVNTCEKLAHQSEQIKRIVGGLESIDNKVDKAEDTVGRIKSVTGKGIWFSIKKFFAGPKRTRDVIDDARSSQKHEGATTSKKVSDSKKKAERATRVTPDPIDAALDVLDMQMVQLKGMAVNMGQELDYQNELLDVANKAADVANDNLKHVVREVRSAY